MKKQVEESEDHHTNTYEGIHQHPMVEEGSGADNQHLFQNHPVGEKRQRVLQPDQQWEQRKRFIAEDAEGSAPRSETNYNFSSNDELLFNFNSHSHMGHM